MIYTNQTGAVRCCSLDGGSCKSETPDCSSLTFLEAQQKCINFGMRLCSEQELSSNICCNTGCYFDVELVWYTKGNMFCLSIKILMQPFPTWLGVMFPCLVLWFHLILCSDLKWLHCRYIGPPEWLPNDSRIHCYQWLYLANGCNQNLGTASGCNLVVNICSV